MLTVPVETLLRVGTFGSYTDYLDRFLPILNRLRFDPLSRSNFNLANLFLFDRFQFSNENKLLIQSVKLIFQRTKTGSWDSIIILLTINGFHVPVTSGNRVSFRSLSISPVQINR